MKPFLLNLVMLLPIFGIAQTTDNSGKDLFVVKNTGGFSFPVTSTGIGLSYTSSLNAKDTFEITLHKFTKFTTAGVAPALLFIKNGKFFRIRDRNNGLVTYYLTNKLEELLKSQVGLLIIAIHQFGLNSFNQLQDYNYKPTIDAMIAYFEAHHVNTDGIYTVSDVGNWSSPFFINFKVSNLSFSSLGKFFTSANQPTIQLEIGAMENAVVKFKNWDNLKIVKSFLGIKEWDFFYSVFANTNMVTYIDTINQKRVPYSIRSFPKFNQYGFKTNLNGYWSQNLAFSLTTTTWYGLPLDNDKNYQLKQSSPILTADTVNYTLGRPAGKYGGDVHKKLLNTRISIAFPYFMDVHRIYEWVTGRIAPTAKTVYLMPSYAPFISTDMHWTHQVGLSVNFLSDAYGKINSSIVQAGGFGFDVLSDSKMHTGWGSPIFYVSGTINLGALNTQKGKLDIK